MSNKYVRRERGSVIFVAVCRQNGPCDHVRHTDREQAAVCARALDESTGHFHAIKEASSISGNVFDVRPFYPTKTVDGQPAKIGRHPLTGEPCR